MIPDQNHEAVLDIANSNLFNVAIGFHETSPFRHTVSIRHFVGMCLEELLVSTGSSPLFAHELIGIACLLQAC